MWPWLLAVGAPRARRLCAGREYMARRVAQAGRAEAKASLGCSKLKAAVETSKASLKMVRERKQTVS